MTSEAGLSAWQIFLRGRIAQEQGKDEEALKRFDRALQLDPNNQHFLKAKTNALIRLNRNEDAFSSRISEHYAELANRYVGDADRPGPWIEGLEGLLQRAEGFSPSETLGVFW